MSHGFTGHAWRRPLVVAALATVAMSAPFAHADDAAGLAAAGSSALAKGSADTTLALDLRLRTELRAVMTELIEAGAFGDRKPEQIALAVDSPAQRVSDLGVLVDSSRDDRNGLHVLAVTPGGSAERMGMRAGDVLIAMNGVPFAGDGRTAAAGLRRNIDGLPDGSALAFTVRRDGDTRTISGPLSSVYLPAMRLTIGEGAQLASASGAQPIGAAAGAALPAAAGGCGRISDFDAAPRQQQLHGARIISIDGVTPGPTGATSYRVAAGPHALMVANLIESRYLGFGDRLRNSGPPRDHYKALTVDVEPDTTTLVAARLNDDARNEWRRDAYWDPVAWKQVAEPCH